MNEKREKNKNPHKYDMDIIQFRTYKTDEAVENDNNKKIVAHQQ